MTKFDIEAERSLACDDNEVRRRLGRVYSLILSYDHQERHADEQDPADDNEPGNLPVESARLDATPEVLHEHCS